jgi:hypothetical protein
MQYCDRPELTDYLTNFTGQDPVKSAACPFVQDAGAGMGLTVFSLFFFGAIGLSLTARAQHPGPIVVAMMLTGGVATFALPGIAAKIAMLVLLFAISGLGVYLYARAQSSL